jgi:hypothetical protein
VRAEAAVPATVPAASRWRARLALIALFALFFVPIMGAFILNAFAPGWLPFGRLNHGELEQPARPAGLARVHVLEGPAWVDTTAMAPWTLVHVGDPVCEDACQQALVNMRQARLALGKDADRVSRWWLATGTPEAASVARARSIDPGLRIGQVGSDAGVLTEDTARGMVQLVDPAGYLILRYRDADAASAILKDLKRLLKISKQG